MEQCPIKVKISDRIIDECNIDEKTDEYENPQLHQDIQNELGQHLVSCDHESCKVSTNARINVGLMDASGKYLKGIDSE